MRAVAWLDAAHPFPTGDLPPPVVDRIRAYAERWGQSVDDLGWPAAGGPHTCELCLNFRAGGNFGVPAGDVLFVCPEMLGHYVAAHSYLPPGEFVDAIMAASLPGSEEYARAVARFRPTRFVVRDTFRLSKRPGVYLAGKIASGTIREGMVARVPTGGGRVHMVPVVAVEFVDGPGRESALGLQLAVESPEQQAAIEALLAESVIEIAEPFG